MGWIIGTCTVPKTVMVRVEARRPPAQVMVSSEVALTLVAPPKPFQRATGTRHSKPASSAACARRRLLFQLESHRSGKVVKARPPEQFAPKSPSLNALPPRRPGLRGSVMAARGQGAPFHSAPAIQSPLATDGRRAFRSRRRADRSAFAGPAPAARVLPR